MLLSKVEANKKQSEVNLEFDKTSAREKTVLTLCGFRVRDHGYLKQDGIVSRIQNYGYILAKSKQINIQELFGILIEAWVRICTSQKPEGTGPCQLEPAEDRRTDCPIRERTDSQRAARLRRARSA